MSVWGCASLEAGGMFLSDADGQAAIDASYEATAIQGDPVGSDAAT